MKQASEGHSLHNADLQVNEMINPKDIHGVQEAKIAVRDPETGKWVNKTAKTSFFPEEWSKRRVAQEIEGAFRESKPDPQQPQIWVGKASNGLEIRGYYGKPDGSAATAWPVYVKPKVKGKE